MDDEHIKTLLTQSNIDELNIFLVFWTHVRFYTIKTKAWNIIYKNVTITYIR